MTVRWWRRGGTVLAAALAGLGSMQGPAFASEDGEFVFVPSEVTVSSSGGPQEATVQLSATSEDSSYEIEVDTELKGLDDVVEYELSGGNGCEPDGDTTLSCVLDAGETVDFRVTFTPAVDGSHKPKERDGEFKLEATFTNTETDHDFDEQAELPVAVAVDAGGDDEEKPAAGVEAVTGTVGGAGGTPLAGVEVVVTDSAGARFTDTTKETGAFRVEPSAEAPIAPGELVVEASGTGLSPVRVTVTGEAGQVATVALSMTAAPAASGDGSGDGSAWPYIAVGLALILGFTIALVVVSRRRSARSAPVPAPSGAVNPPTMVYDQVDGDLARYGSGGNAPGFGPAYGYGDPPTEEIDPTAFPKRPR